MKLSGLLEEEGVADVIVTEQHLFLLLRHKRKSPLIYTEKEIILVLLDELLVSKYLSSILQGTSLRHGDLTERPCMFEFHLYEYSLKKLPPAKKQRFSHLLHGTKQVSSLLEKLEGKRIGKGAFVVPVSAKDVAENHLKTFKATWTCTKVFFEEDPR